MSVLTAPLPRTAGTVSLRILAGALPDPAWLAGSLRDQAIATPAWQQYVARADCTEEVLSAPGARAEPGHLRLMAKMHALPGASAWPAFELARQGLLPLDKPVWRATPVHFLLGRDHVRLSDPATLELDASQASALLASVRALFLEDGLELTLHSPQVWSMHPTGLASPWQLETYSLAGAIGRSIDARLPEGPHARRWRRLLNELQMTWFDHPINQTRESQGLWPINGLWIEGPAGPFPAGASADPRACTLEVRSDERLHQAQMSGDPQSWLQVWQSIWSEPWPEFAPGARLALTGDAGWRILDFGIARPWWKRLLPRRPPAGSGHPAPPHAVGLARPPHAARHWLSVEPS
jgi:hypothetical protein